MSSSDRIPVPGEGSETESAPESSDRYAELAAVLHSIADDIATLAGRRLAEPYVMFGLSFHAAEGDDEASIAAVDAAGMALLGKTGQTRPVGGGYHHDVSGRRGEVSVSVYDAVSPPEQRALREEIARLTAERDALRAETGQPEPSGEESER